MAPHLTSSPMMTFFTSAMSYHTSEQLARALVLLVFAVLIVDCSITGVSNWRQP
jgi:hypothetical protein